LSKWKTPDSSPRKTSYAPTALASSKPETIYYSNATDIIRRGGLQTPPYSAYSCSSKATLVPSALMTDNQIIFK